MRGKVLQNLEGINWRRRLGLVKRREHMFQGMYSGMFLRIFQTRTGNTFDGYFTFERLGLMGQATGNQGDKSISLEEYS